jgi:TPR repeat protein
MSFSVLGSVDQGIAAYNSGDYPTALREFSEAAKAGDPAGKHLLASLYYQGHGVERDLKRLWRSSPRRPLRIIDRPWPILRSCTQWATGFQRTPKWPSSSADELPNWEIYSRNSVSGSPTAKGPAFSQDYVQAAYWYRKAAEAGSTSAQGEYGLLFAQGQGVSLDYVQAYAWMELAASAGDSESSENRDHLLTLLSASQKEAARKVAVDYMRRYPSKK